MFLIRLLTAVVAFVLLFCFFYVGGSMLVGFEVGFETAMEQEKANDGVIDVNKVRSEAKQKAATEVEAHIGTIALVAASLSGVIAVIVGFSGIFPWCRSRTHGESTASS